MHHFVLHADKDDGESGGESGEIDEGRKDDGIKVGEEDGEESGEVYEGKQDGETEVEER